MRFRGVLVVAVAVAVVGALAVLLWPSRPGRCPLELKLVSLEGAGIYDDTGMEMWLVTLSISNSANQPPRTENDIHVKDSGRPIEARVANHWIAAEGTLVCRLGRGQKHESLLLIPADTDCCRVRFKCAGSSLSFKGRRFKESVGWIVARLPIFVRSRLSYKFWRWLGFSRYEASSDWREIIVELPLPPTPPRPGGRLLRAENPITELDARSVV